MRLLHLADTHLGFRQFAGRLDPARGINQREADVYRSWHFAIDHAIASAVDVVVHAGDLFDGPRPTPRAVAEALDGFARLHRAGIPVVVIAGNHSTPRSRSGGSVFEVLGRFPGVHAVWEAPQRIDIRGTSFHAVPHPGAELSGVRPGPGSNVLILHGGLDSAKATYGEAGAVDFSAQAIGALDFDYIALGHLHAFRRVGANAAYSGSLERLDFADTAEKVLVEVDLSGGLNTFPVPARRVFTIDVACAGLGPGEALAAVETAVAAVDCVDAVVRLRLDGLARDVYQALDTRRVAALFADALHHVVSVGVTGLSAAETVDSGGLDFEAFALERVPAGVDGGRVLELARGFLRAAGAEEVEEGVA